MSRESVRRTGELDWGVLLAALLLALVGVSALASNGGLESSLASRQMAWVGVGLTGLLVFLLVSYRTWGEWAWILYSLNALALVYVVLFGHRVNGSRSWVVLGPANLQPSEFMKIGTILVLAKLLGAHHGDGATLALAARLSLVAAIPLGLIALQPDMGTALTFAAVFGVMLAVAGLSRKAWIVVGLTGALAVVAGWNWVLKDYQKQRIRTFLVPETDPKAAGYQTIQSRIAIGSGGYAGKGYASGTQSQLNFIPEKHTDFVFPVVAEEWGFLGSALVIGLYGLLVTRGLRIAAQARDAFGAYLCLGIISLIATHVAINLGMVTGLLPTIGIPLPLMSYGGSSTVSTLAAVGLVLNVRLRRTAIS